MSQPEGKDANDGLPYGISRRDMELAERLPGRTYAVAVALAYLWALHAFGSHHGGEDYTPILVLFVFAVTSPAAVWVLVRQFRKAGRDWLIIVTACIHALPGLFVVGLFMVGMIIRP